MIFRDEAQTKILALREKAEKEYQSYIQEIKELDRALEQDRKLKEFMATKMMHRKGQPLTAKMGIKKGIYFLTFRKGESEQCQFSSRIYDRLTRYLRKRIF
jgi:uncharacterized protein YkwD